MINMIINKIKKNSKYIIIILIITLIVVILYRLNNNNINEKFENEQIKTIISQWDNHTGFYSELLSKLNHYIYCKKNKINFKISHNNWNYTFKDGWTDYFENNELTFNNDEENDNNVKKMNGCCDKLDDYKLSEYVEIIPEFYRYNQKTKDFIANKKKELGLEGIEYGALYIRRGDKLVNEIDFITTDKFADKLIEVYPTCKTIFLQTDDYNCFLDLEKYIKDKGLDIKLTTLCPSNNFGAISSKNWENQIKDKIQSQESNQNKDYLEKIKNNLSKPITEMNPDEKYAHTMELISSVDFCINSKYCVCDYKSNVSRFIKLAHKNIENVYDVNLQDKKLFLNIVTPPVFNFI
jgi:hypothetical protein